MDRRNLARITQGERRTGLPVVVQRKDAKGAKKVRDTRRRGDAEQFENRAIDPMPSEDRPLPALLRE
jgi:hypothetical protein